MKRTTALILLVGLLFALTACGRTADDKLTLYEGNALKIEREGAITRIYDLEGGGEYTFTTHRTRAKKGTEDHNHHGHKGDTMTPAKKTLPEGFFLLSARKGGKNGTCKP